MQPNRIKVVERVERLPGEGALEVFAVASAMEAQGRDIVHLEIGEPDSPTPSHIVRAAIQALEAGQTCYTPAPGIPELREAIARDISSRRQIDVDSSQVVVTTGSKIVAFYTMLALLEPGDEVIYPNPGFPVYEAMIEFTGATPVPIRLDEAGGFRMSLDDIRGKVSNRTKLIVLNSPQNPTGAVLERGDLEEIAGIARHSGIYVLSDEIYNRLQYEGRFVSIAALSGMKERTIILDGFSKTYAMTGWRLGYGVMPEELATHITKLIINSNSCTCTFVQRAGVEALRGPQDVVDKMVESYRRRRDLIVKSLNAIPGMSCACPRGAFYAFPNIRAFGKKAKDLADYLLIEAGVATLPGTAFGEWGEGYLRLSYANSDENIQRAVERIAAALSRL
jgi:aspartate/methionine/tyrosine aminotransferase